MLAEYGRVLMNRSLSSSEIRAVETLGHAVGEHPRKFVLRFDHRARRLGVAPLQRLLLNILLIVPPVSPPRSALLSEEAMASWRLWLLCWVLLRGAAAARCVLREGQKPRWWLCVFCRKL